MENVLVVGGAGYVGSHAAKALKKAGYTPVVFDNFSSGSEQAVLFGPVEKGDVLDRPALERVFEKYDFAGVFHFASKLSVPESIVKPFDYYLNNVTGALNAADVARLAGVKHFIFSSSAAVYGIPEALPLTEDSLIEPITPYGRTKRFVEMILSDFDRAYGLKSMSLRYFNAVGADPDLEIGLFQEAQATHLIPRIFQAIKTGRPIKVFGRDYPTKDGTCVRDYIHVWDLALAHVKAFEYLKAGGDTVQLNLGSGKGYSVLEIIDKVESVTGKKVPFIDDIRRAGDPPILVSSQKEMIATLHYVPAYSDLDTIVRTAYAFSQKI